MRTAFLLGLALLVAVTLAFVFSPWPGVMVVRAVFDHGAATAAARLAPYVPAGVTTTTLTYDPADPDAVLDILRLPDTPATAPVVVWIHGGGFVSGRRQDISSYLRILAGRGLTVVNVDYTIAPAATYPTPLRQVNAALAFLGREGAAHGLPAGAGRFVLAGDSAGAQIAAQVTAMIANPDYAAKVGVTPGATQAQIAGVLLFCWVYDVQGLGQGGGNPVLRAFVHLTGWAYGGTWHWRDSAVLAGMAIAPHLTPAFPPAFISAGNADPLGPQSVAFASALSANGTPVETLFFPAGHQPPLGHEYQFDMDGADGQGALEAAVAWLRRL